MKKEPELPWRLPRGMKRWFVPARRAAGLTGGGTVHAEVFLGKNGSGDWHPITLATDGQGFEKLAAMAERSRMLLLESLACLPVREKLLTKTEKHRPRGKHNQQSRTCWFTARYLGPLLLWWARDSDRKKTPLYRWAMKALRDSEATERTPEAVAAYLVERNWENAHNLNPQRFQSWPGPRPSSRPATFWKRIPAAQQLVWPARPDHVVKGILKGTHHRHVYILTSQDIERTLPMTDFRIF
jgi:hypothetical protein